MATKFSKDIKKFNEYCGEILRIGASVESDLELFISHYYSQPEKQVSFHYNVIAGIRFVMKINIFCKILEEEQIEKKEVTEIRNILNYIRDIRNRVAHHEAMISDPKGVVKLHKKSSLIKSKDQIDVTSQLVGKVEQKRQEFIKKRTELYKILFNPHYRKDSVLIG